MDGRSRQIDDSKKREQNEKKKNRDIYIISVCQADSTGVFLCVGVFSSNPLEP